MSSEKYDLFSLVTTITALKNSLAAIKDIPAPYSDVELVKDMIADLEKVIIKYEDDFERLKPNCNCKNGYYLCQSKFGDESSKYKCEICDKIVEY